MHIRTPKKFYNKLSKNKTTIKIEIDNNLDFPVLMGKEHGGNIQQIMGGFDECNSFLKHGYNRIVKYCPIIKKKCKAEKCQHYLINGITADCIKKWMFFK